jgi:hypothetical protein
VIVVCCRYRVLVCAPSNTAIDELLDRVVRDVHRYLPNPSNAAASASASDELTGDEFIARCVRLGKTERMRPTDATTRLNLETLTTNYLASAKCKSNQA